VEACPTEDMRWMQEVVRAAASGACVMIIRNTVDLARATYLRLRDMCQESTIHFGLIHSRFTQSDRNLNESKWTKLLGRDGTERPPKGAILVGTQVLEQSLDIDADLLVTDLAPTDLILQRMGRLHRHQRLRPAGHETPRCIVLRPKVDWQNPKAEILRELTPHRFVYPPFTLYMADSVWSETRVVSLPEDIRTILEASASLPESAPEAVRELWREANAEAQKMRDAAWVNDVFKVPAADDSESARTRWGIQPTGWIVVLAQEPRTSGDNVELFFPGSQRHTLAKGTFDFTVAKLLRLHAVRAPAYLLNGLSRTRPPWLEDHLPDAALAVLDGSGGLTTWPEDNSAYAFTYNPTVGLAFSRKEGNGLPTTSTEEPSWH
jgi:CRISPR-associated endonuclease/helicase Cas3